MPIAPANVPVPPWWGPYTVPVQQMYHWHLGALHSWMLRDAHEWRVAWEAGRDPLHDANTCEGPMAVDEAAFSWSDPPDAYTLARYSMHATEATLRVQPALADRALVVRPEHPISIPPDEAITLFVSTPLWMRILVHEREHQLLEMPTVRLSDTWFGASTRAGELCYAARTTGRLHLDNVPRRPHRAITPIRIRNQARDTLLLERVQMPATHLALYETDEAVLWTQALTLEREANRGATGPAAAVHIRPGAPPEAEGATRLTEPREPVRRNLFVSTFSAVGALFGS